MECSKKIYELNNPTHTFTLKDKYYKCIRYPLDVSFTLDSLKPTLSSICC